jgi:hypothetical protein
MLFHQDKQAVIDLLTQIDKIDSDSEINESLKIKIEKMIN